MKTKIYFLIIIIFLFSISTFSANYTISSSSFLGGSGNDVIISANIQTDGTIVLAGNINLSVIKGVNATLLNGTTTASLGTIVRISTDGQTVLSVTKIGNTIADMDIDGNDNIFVALDLQGFLKLNPIASSILWSVTDKDILRVDAGPSGFCAALGAKSSFDFNGLHLIRLYNPAGQLILDRWDELRFLDISVNEDEQTLTGCGFNIDFLGINEYHLAFNRAFSFNGAIRYTGYNWKAQDWINRNAYEHTRSNSCATGQDGKFYVYNAWTGNGYSCLVHDPFDRSKKVNLVATDKYQNIAQMTWGEEGSTKKKLLLFRYDPKTGAYLNGTPFCNVPSQGPGTIDSKGPGSIQADYEGNLYITGGSAAGMPIAPYHSIPNPGEELINAMNDSYAGGPIIVIFNNDFTVRKLTASLGTGSFRSINVRRLKGTTVVVAVGEGNSANFFTKDAIQATKGANNDGLFTIINTPGTAGIPTSPSSLIISSSSATFVKLKWNDLSTNEDGFIIERKTASGSFVQIASVFPEDTNFTDLTINPLVNYTYRVKAFTMDGGSSYSNEVNLTTSSPIPPLAPQNVFAFELNENQVKVNWTDVLTETGYVVEQRKQGSQFFETLVELPANTTSFNVLDLYSGTKYTYRIRAFNNDGFSPYSDSTQVITKNLNLKTAINPSNTSQGICYRLYEKTTDLSYWADFDRLPIKKTGNQSGLLPIAKDTMKDNYSIIYHGYLNISDDATYLFTYRANKSGILFIDDSMVIDNSTWKWGAWQENGQIGLKKGMHKFIMEFNFVYAKGTVPIQELYIESKTIPKQLIPDNMLFRDNNCEFVSAIPNPPINLSHQIISGDKVKLMWEDNSTNESGFAIEITPYNWDSYDRFRELITVPANSTSYIMNHFLPDSLYEVRIRALNAYGYSSYSEIDSIIPVGPITNAPTPPDNLMSNFNSATQVNLLWRDNSFNETNFVIEYKTTGSFSTITTTVIDINSVSVSGLLPSTTYYFRVYAKNSYGNSTPSNEIMVSTTMGSANPPNAPLNLASGVTLNSVLLSWQDNSIDETGFRIERKEGSGAYDLLDVVGANNATYTDNSVKASTTYTYRISAYNINGNSSFSNEEVVVITDSYSIFNIEDKVAVFPNPVIDELSIKNSIINNVRVTNVDGTVVLERSNVNSINIYNLIPGIYFVTIDTDSKHDVFKIVKK